MDGINTIRHVSLFDPAWFEHKGGEVTIIGCGAIGSKIAVEIAKLGITSIHLWDDDIVEGHNIANQAFFPTMIDMPKVLATAQMISTFGAIPTQHSERYKGQVPLTSVVFLCPDSINTRKTLFADFIRLKPHVKLMVDIRMNMMDGRIYWINPTNYRHIKLWEAASNYTDEVAEVSPCGTPISLGPTSGIFANLAVNGFMRAMWDMDMAVPHKHEKLKIEAPPQEAIVCLNPNFVVIEQSV